MEVIGIKRYDMVKRLHNYRTIVQFHGTLVDKRLVRHVVTTIVTLYARNLIIFDKQVSDTTTGTSPDVVCIIFYHTMHHLVHQTILNRKQVRLLTWAFQQHTSIETSPRPATTVCKFTVDVTA